MMTTTTPTSDDGASLLFASMGAASRCPDRGALCARGWRRSRSRGPCGCGSMRTIVVERRRRDERNEATTTKDFDANRAWWGRRRKKEKKTQQQQTLSPSSLFQPPPPTTNNSSSRRRLPPQVPGPPGQAPQAHGLGHGGPGALPHAHQQLLPRRAGHHLWCAGGGGGGMGRRRRA